MIKINILQEKCIHCGACGRDCPVGVLLNNGPDPAILHGCLNCQHCLAVCPTGALICNGVRAEECMPIGALPSAGEMLNVLRQRRSIRQYQNVSVTVETLEQLKAALAWSPTGCNDHNLYFAIVERKEEMDFFRVNVNKMLRILYASGFIALFLPRFKRFLQDVIAGKDVIFRDAPHMIVAATPRKAPCKEADPWIALSYLDCYAQTLGLGTCWCGFAVHAFKWNRKLRKRLGIPHGYQVGAVLLFGKSAVEYCRSTSPRNYSIYRVGQE